MNSTNHDEIKQLIENEIIKTEKGIEEYKDMTKPIAPENAIGRLTRLDAINNKSVTEAALRQAEEKLKKLKLALTKVGTDDFGICHKCQKEIPIKRILLMPHSVFCVQCAK